MYWIKKSLLFSFILVVFNGCNGGVGYTMAKSMGYLPNPEKGKVYLEKFDNDIFLEYILEHKFIKGLKKKDVIYIDNSLGRPNSTKIILTKKFIYKVLTFKNYKILDQYDFKNDMILSKYKYVTKHTFLKTKLDENTLYIYIRDKKGKWYLPKKWFSIGSRYNNIHKIKEIIDERVAYHKKHKTYEKDEN